MTCFKKRTFTMKKESYSFLKNLQSVISLRTLKLALNKSMRKSDDEQGINKLWPSTGAPQSSSVAPTYINYPYGHVACNIAVYVC